ncbi:MAG: hypothetical protein AB7X49_11050 [Geminicoccaceae bacterium]
MTLCNPTLWQIALVGVVATGVLQVSPHAEAAATRGSPGLEHRAVRLEALADRNATVVGRENQIASRLHAALDQGNAAKAESLVDRLHRLARWDQNILAHADAVTGRIDARIDQAQQPNLDHHLDMIDRAVDESQGIATVERRLSGTIDARLDNGRAGGGTEALAGRVTNETDRSMDWGRLTDARADRLEGLLQ